eukprot:superscaffoldBa00003726_g17570
MKAAVGSCKPHSVAEPLICKLCTGTVLNNTEVGQFCSSSAGRIEGRCCLRNDNTSDPEHIIGDLSLNSIVNISDLVFQGFIELHYVILPADIVSINCPENSLCGPYGPGFFECSCADNYHGYKCLREGEFPLLQVFGPLGASTVVISVLLWVTQRRKVKPL